MDAEFLRRLEELLGPNSWQEHKAPISEPVPEPTAPDQLIDVSEAQKTISEDGSDAEDISTTMKRPLEHVSWPETGLRKGERIEKDALFIPWKLVKSYPHQYIGKANGERAKHFFDNPTIHMHHPWDFFYIYDPTDLKDRHILFVPTYQFEHLLGIINTNLGTVLTIPVKGGNIVEKFQITFGIGGSPVPRFLGRSTSFDTFEALEKSLPSWNQQDDLRHLSTMAQGDFVDKLKAIRASSKHTKSKKSEKRRIVRIQDHKSWGKSVKRVQRYLGIRKKTADLPALEKMSLTETQATKPTAAGVPVVAKPEQSVVFVCIDIEAFEKNQDVITEIGVAVFDTLDIDNLSPGEKGENWFPLIRAHHYRIKENSWAENGVYVAGNAGNFDFGTTEFVGVYGVKDVVKKIIDNPGSLLSKENGPPASHRPVVLVFHDSEADIKYLEVIKYDVAKANVLEIVDTRDMYQHRVKANNPASLERVLADLNIQSRYLHNAGNDAVYTMQAMIGLAFQQRKKSLERAATKGVKPAWNQEDYKEGWGTGGEESDGGTPGQKAPPSTASSLFPYLRGRAFQPGEDVPTRAPSPPSNVFSWSDEENDMADAEHLQDW